MSGRRAVELKAPSLSVGAVCSSSQNAPIPLVASSKGSADRGVSTDAKSVLREHMLAALPVLDIALLALIAAIEFKEHVERRPIGIPLLVLDTGADTLLPSRSGCFQTFDRKRSACWLAHPWQRA